MDESGKNSTLWIRMVSFEKIKMHGISKKRKKKKEKKNIRGFWEEEKVREF